MIFRVIRKARAILKMWKARGGIYVLLFVFARLFPSPRLFRRWANSISRNSVPEMLVSLSGVYTNQAWPKRTEALEALAKSNLSSTFVAMEIGTWFGEGSTSIWAKYLKKGSQLFLIDIWSEYISEADKATDSAYSAMDSVHHIAINSALKKVYEYQEKSDGEIYVLRGKASKLCRFFKPNTFDFIYIDGSHYYEEVLEDIRLAKSLIKDGGTICGDDLEVEPTEARVELARRNIHRDFIKSEDDGLSFHPGVFLAVYEHFPAVTNHAGIWSVIKRGEDWVAA